MERPTPYRIAGIDVHKKLLALVVADVEVDDDFHFERQKVGTTPADLRAWPAGWSSTREQRAEFFLARSPTENGPHPRVRLELEVAR